MPLRSSVLSYFFILLNIMKLLKLSLGHIFMFSSIIIRYFRERVNESSRDMVLSIEKQTLIRLIVDDISPKKLDRKLQGGLMS